MMKDTDMRRRRGGLTNNKRSSPNLNSASRSSPVLPSQIPFPLCAKDALNQVDRFIKINFGAQDTFYHPTPQSRNLIELQINLDHDLFGVQAGRNVDRKCRWDPIQELEMIDMITQYFKDKCELFRTDKEVYRHFELIFLGREGELNLHEMRIQLLTKLLPYAIQMDASQILNHVAHWLSKLAFGKEYGKNIVIQIAETLCADLDKDIKDKKDDSLEIFATPDEDIYFVEEDLSPNLFPLVNNAPQFVPFFFGIVLEDLKPDKRFSTPILNVISEWMSLNPKNIIKSLKGSVLSPVSKMLTTGIHNLVMYTCLTQIVAPSENCGNYELECRIQTGILHVLLCVTDVFAKESISIITESLLTNILQVINTHLPLKTTHKIGVCVERTAQIFQVSLACNCFQGSKHNVIEKYDLLNFEDQLFKTLAK